MGIDGVSYMDGVNVVSAPDSANAAPAPAVTPVQSGEQSGSQQSSVQTPQTSQTADVSAAGSSKQGSVNQTQGISADHPLAYDDKHIVSTLDKAIAEVNKQMSGTADYMQYDYYKPTKTVTIKVVDKDTNKVVREIPPKAHLEAIAKMWELAGIIVDEKK